MDASTCTNKEPCREAGATQTTASCSGSSYDSYCEARRGNFVHSSLADRVAVTFEQLQERTRRQRHAIVHLLRERDSYRLALATRRRVRNE